MASYDPSEQAIVDILTPLTQLALQQQWRETAWTKEIQKALINLGHSHGFLTCSAPQPECSSTFGEGLYDVVWFEQTTDEHGISDLVHLP